MIRNFKDLVTWQNGNELAVDIFKLWEGIDSRGYFGLREQMQNSAVSIPSNIAEGHERKSAIEFVRYLYIAKGSAAELRTQLGILSRIGIAGDIDLSTHIERTEILLKQLQSLISKVYQGQPPKKK